MLKRIVNNDIVKVDINTNSLLSVEPPEQHLRLFVFSGGGVSFVGPFDSSLYIFYIIKYSKFKKC
jgi:hypothetical protein